MALLHPIDVPALPLAGSPPAATEELHSAVEERVKLPFALTIFLLVWASSMLDSFLTSHSHGVVTLWIGNGLLFAILIRRPRPTWPAYLAIGYCADAFGVCITGSDTVLTSLVVSACNTLEVAIAAYLLYRFFGRSFMVSRPSPLFAFLGLGVLLAPAIACSLAALWYVFAAHAPFGSTLRTWFLGDAVGMAIVAPFVCAVQEPDFFAMFRPQLLVKTLFVLSTSIFATVTDFQQHNAPFPLLIMPALVFITFRRGFPGAVIGVFLTACIALPSALGGRGLMSMAPSGETLHNIVSVQFFIVITLFTIFPVAALLEESRSLARSLKQSERRYMELANTDALTGQPNRRAFDERLVDEWQKAAAAASPLALLALDVDFFKKYNDLYGHIAGDDCLRRIAMTAADTLHRHTTARLYRLGGEEFAILLVPGDPGKALELAEQIRLAILAEAITHADTALGLQTISIGVATTLPDPHGQPLALVDLADQALYRAKANGRNRCELVS